MRPEILALLAVVCASGLSMSMGQNAGSDVSASTSCNPAFDPTSPNLCLRDIGKLQACSKRLTAIEKDRECNRQRSLWNCVWHQLRTEECKGRFPLVRNQLPAQCRDSSGKNIVQSTTLYGTRGLALWLSCIHAFSSCEYYWSCNSKDLFKACVANSRKLLSPQMLPTVNKVSSVLEDVHQRVRCLNTSSTSVFPYEFKACLWGASQHALSHIAALARYDPAVTMVNSRTQGPAGCLSSEKLEQNLSKMHKDCPIFLQKFDQPSYAAIREIFEKLLPEAEGSRCRGHSTDPDYKPVQMCP